MQITSLDRMESIVNSKSNLAWDGWDVLSYTRDNAGFLKKNGVYKNGRWHTVKRFSPDCDGWSIPDRWAT